MPDLLCSAADQAHRAFAARGLSGVRAARDGLCRTVRLAFDDGHRRLNGTGGGQEALWIADPQHARDRLTGHYCPACGIARATDGDSVQCRETLGSKEIQVAQIKDQLAATQQMTKRVLSQGVSVGRVDATVGPDDNYR